MISDINIRVDRDKCIACGRCVERCIMDNLRLSVSPCRQQCPIRMNCQGYVRLIAQGKEKEAVAELQPFHPFIGILGRACMHPCEAACERGKVDGPVHIRALKRYLADSYPDLLFAPPGIQRETGRSAAIVGSGPAGLMAAFELRLQGHSVTVFEADSEPGGNMRYTIPSFKLPVREVQRTVDYLAATGIRFKTGTRVDLREDLPRMESEYHSVILAVGTGSPFAPKIPGIEQRRVVQAVDLLRRVKNGENVDIGTRVLVIGGGNTAMDAALICRRLGAGEVRVACVERLHEMPASADSLDEARRAGICFEYGWGVAEVGAAECGCTDIGLARCLSLADEQGKFRPELESECSKRLAADLVVLAMGQNRVPEGMPPELLDEHTGCLAADPLTLQMVNRPKLFVCGDLWAGASSIVHGLASGREAALSADRLLRGEGLRWGRGPWNPAWTREYESLPERARGGARCELPRTGGLGAGTSDCGDERPFSREEAEREAERCLSCGRSFEMNKTCWYCLPCEIDCPVQALEVRMPYLVR